MRRPASRGIQSRLFWCDRCNVPLIGPSCGKCGSGGRRVDLSPPGDVRLALEGTKKRLRYLFLRDFGVQQLIPDIFVLNKTSGEDRADEVIVDGRRVALLYYDIERQDYGLTLRIDGARLLAGMDSRKVVLLEKTPGHMKGRYLPPGSITKADPGIRAGDDVVICMGKFIGCGSAKVDYGEIRTNPKGIRVRDISQAGPLSPGRRAWPKDLVGANREHLIAKKSRAEREMQAAVAQKNLPLTVSFSGGKDSLVVLDLVSSLRSNFSVIFVDTGLEHPRTLEYVSDLSLRRGIRLLTASAGDDFEENFPTFGPPAKDFRWCCKVCKLAPASKLIEKHFPEGTVTVEGNRRLESFARGRIDLVESNPFVPGQIILNPIRDWTALDVWLYIIWRNLEFNPLYMEDIERVGCWMCPSALASEYAEISRLSPELSKRWEARLTTWAEENSLPREFVRFGLWRWKGLPPKMKSLAERMGLDVEPTRPDKLNLRILKGISPCVAGGYSIDAILGTRGPAGLQSVAEMLKTVGEVSLVEDFGVVLIRRGGSSAKVFAGGQITAVGENPELASELFESVARAILRADMCTECGICARTCEVEAIEIDGGVRVDAARCTKCGKCAESCVVAHYFDKLATASTTAKKSPRERPPAR